MKKKLLSILALTLCMASSTWALDQVDGVYQIGSAQDLRDFATTVNGGEYGAFAVLTTNIDLNNEAWTSPIGSESHPYTGTFDGKGFTISNLNYTSTANNTGFFGQIGNGAVVKGFTIDGIITSLHQRVSVIGSVAGSASATISYIHSEITLTCTQTRHGGILGAQNGTGTVNIDHCTFSGVLDAGNATGNFGGIVGLTNNNSGSIVNISNCLFDGTVKNGTGTNAGGIIGYTNKTKVTITNCLSNGTIESTNPGQFFGQLNASNSKWSGVNYYVTTGSIIGTIENNATLSGTAPIQATSAQLESGELCYLLNEKTGTSWLQTKGIDNYPVLLSTSKRIYKNLAGEYVNVDTPVQIGSETDLKNFAAMVNNGGLDLDAELTDDIDMTGVMSTWIPIGDWGNTSGTSQAAYKGNFNGQGHNITNFTGNTLQNYYGLFGVISTGCLIENFSISGTISNANYQYSGGVAAYARDSSPIIRNVRSSVNINNTYIGSSNAARIGGILGGALNGTTSIQNCTYTGTIHVDNLAGNYGGIVGYVNNNASAILTISNCLFEGTVENINDGTGECGGIIGFASTNSVTTIENCLSVGTVTSTKAGMICGIIAGTKTYTNNYYKDDSGNLVANGPGGNAAYTATAVTTAQLASGEVCYELNGDQSDIAFYQTIGTDANPILDSTHGLVYVNGTVCPDTGTPQGSMSYSNTEGTTIGSHNNVDGICTYCGTPDASYLTANSEGFYEIGNKKQLVWFAAKVNAGEYNAKAKLTGDIDMDGADISHFPIGDASATSKYFIGTFDGQGHKLSNFKLVNTSAPTNYGMFNATTGVVLKNFWLDSSCEIHGAEMVGLIGHLYAGGTLEGIGNCADVTGKQNNIGGLIGGVTGNSSSKKDITIKNCWTTGKVETTNPSVGNGKDCGALTGWFNNAKITIEGFWTVADVVNPSAANKYVYRNGGGASFTIRNSFSKNGEQADYTNFTDEQLANGWLCYGLNGDQSNIAWYQTIGTDDTPVLDSNSKQVYELEVKAAGWASFVPTVSIDALPTGVTTYVGQKTGASLHLEEVTELPADNAFVVKANEGKYYYNGSDAALTLSQDNDFEFSGTAFAANGTHYCLAKKNDVVGFYKVNSGIQIPARKVYLVVTNSVKSFYGFEEDDATALNNLKDSKDSNDIIFNLAGQRMGKVQKGINIMNGKKILK